MQSYFLVIEINNNKKKIYFSKNDFLISIYLSVFNNENTLEMTSEVQITNTTSPANIVLTNNRRNQTKDSIDLESKLNRM